MMNEADLFLPGAVMAGFGATLVARGATLVRSQGRVLTVCALAAAGCAAGAMLGWASLAAALCAAGALAGCASTPLVRPMGMAILGGLGGAAVGALLGVFTGYSDPDLLCGAAALGWAILALLDAPLIAIAWTSTAGAALTTLGILRALPARDGADLARHVVPVAAVFAFLALGGAAFQWHRASAPRLTKPSREAPAGL
jgi:hypothetical protein